MIDILQINYSLTLRILGVECFNKISIKYLMDNPPNHWSLFHVSKDFSEWIKKNYNAQYSDIVYFSSQLDLIFYYSSIEFKYSSFKINFYEKNELENLLTKNIQLQPHVSITEYPFDLLSFREEVIKKEPIYWQKHKFPELALVPYYCVIFRNRKNNIAWKKISYAEFLLIKQFEEGSCILQVCDWINQNDVTQKEIMTANFHNWIKSWFELELFILDKT